MTRIGIVADIHSNLAALRAVLEDGADADAWWCLGDIVGYAAEPGECLDALVRVGAECVVGNHDLASVGVISRERFNVHARAASEWTQGVLEPHQAEFIRGLPEKGIVPKCDALLVHGSPRDPVWEYVVTTAQARDNFAEFTNTLCFNGHSHVPAAFCMTGQGLEAAEAGSVERAKPLHGEALRFVQGGRYLVNAGSVGQPRDGDPRACYLLFEPEEGNVTFRRVEYDIAATQRSIIEAGLGEFLAERLGEGR